ncbi:sesquipedalian-2 isoform X1 [Sturnira hondurensis]|uniref:sesquipedalian-2 isoform X1 n=1 Tax=Sturnira hondurensis TaxID=192404 RepID=UPI00187927DC|nr:sesquipedalian-2 isoform X1 [Sturnira hondurensis]XP_036924290.1 sesquipedalian-2 isoform X1 [Sturnira hondurensis]
MGAMKLNKKSVAHYALSNSPADHMGFLRTWGGPGTPSTPSGTGRRCWFVLKGNLLFSFESREGRAPLGLVVLEGCTVELAEAPVPEEFAFTIRFDAPGVRPHLLAADGPAAQEAWVKALSRASFGYMRLVQPAPEAKWEAEEEMGRQCGSPRESVLCWFSVLGILGALAQDSWYPVINSSLLPGSQRGLPASGTTWEFVYSPACHPVFPCQDPLIATLTSRPGVFFFDCSGRQSGWLHRARGQTSLMPYGHGDNSWIEDAKPGQRMPSPPVHTVCFSLPYCVLPQPHSPTRAIGRLRAS